MIEPTTILITVMVTDVRRVAGWLKRLLRGYGGRVVRIERSDRQNPN
jgi:hypothetical protein